jgi:hypothetical protein
MTISAKANRFYGFFYQGYYFSTWYFCCENTEPYKCG